MAGLLAILSPKDGASKGAPSDEDEDKDEASSSEAGYGTELADLLGVAKEDRGSFNDALAGFVRKCIAEKKSTPYEKK